ncbi:MAG TPA: hypothetical protein VNF00_02745 [Candidatus Acidoferrales bacterium]|nr:hypothetical protein [Candidatus Acidoferrales bacterium]
MTEQPLGPLFVAMTGSLNAPRTAAGIAKRTVMQFARTIAAWQKQGVKIRRVEESQKFGGFSASRRATNA